MLKAIMDEFDAKKRRRILRKQKDSNNVGLRLTIVLPLRSLRLQIRHLWFWHIKNQQKYPCKYILTLGLLIRNIFQYLG